MIIKWHFCSGAWGARPWHPQRSAPPPPSAGALRRAVAPRLERRRHGVAASGCYRGKASGQAVWVWEGTRTSCTVDFRNAKGQTRNVKATFAWQRLKLFPSRCIGSGFGYEGDALHLQDPAVPVSMAFPCTPTPRFQRIGVTSWNG
jgi:hypothetical protein